MLNWYHLKSIATTEAYIYFDKNIRKLPKNSKGEINHTAFGLADNDVDAFRHAYVSGRYTQQYNEHIAEILGIFQETQGYGYGSTTTNPSTAKNMDLWNNAIGRKYGNKAKSPEELAKLLHEALKNGELIIDLQDPREYKGKTSHTVDLDKPIIVLDEKKTGRNEQFIDLLTGNTLSREIFVDKIQSGEYPGYRVSSIDNIPTPMSKPDNRTDNNLG